MTRTNQFSCQRKFLYCLKARTFWSETLLFQVLKKKSEEEKWMSTCVAIQSVIALFSLRMARCPPPLLYCAVLYFCVCAIMPKMPYQSNWHLRTDRWVWLEFTRIVRRSSYFGKQHCVPGGAAAGSHGHPRGTPGKGSGAYELLMVKVRDAWTGCDHDENGAQTGRVYLNKDDQLTAHTNLWHPTNDSFDPMVAGFREYGTNWPLVLLNPVFRYWIGSHL